MTLTSEMKTINSINEINQNFSKKLDKNIKFSPAAGVKELHLEIRALQNTEVGDETKVEMEASKKTKMVPSQKAKIVKSPNATKYYACYKAKMAANQNAKRVGRQNAKM